MWGNFYTLLTDFKIRTYGYLTKSDFFRQRYLKKQWDAFALVDSSGEVIEAVHRCPTWFSCLACGGTAYFLSGQGVAGVRDLAYPLANPLLGDLLIAQYKIGKVDAKLVPSFVPLAVTGVEASEKSATISYKGIGGGPEILRAMSTGALKCTEHALNPHGMAFDTEYELYRKVVIAVDDTDSSVKGATFNTALQLASILNRSSKDFKFVRLTLSLNWPANPAKTTNNASSALVFAVKPGKEDALVNKFEKLIRKCTVSKETGMVVMDKVRVPEVLKAYARKVKREQVTVEEAYRAAEAAGVKAMPVTGERGLIGALSAVGLVDDPAEAVTPVRIDT